MGVLSQEPMYAYDGNDMLIASGGTAGYCAVSQKPGSPYALEYLQAWLSNPYTEQYIRISGSYFEGGFVARGTFILSSLPFVELNFFVPAEKAIHDEVIRFTREVYAINEKLASAPAKSAESVLLRQKKALIEKIESLISRVYKLEF
ncbi:Type IIS restriction enzyme Eco57I [anaerobic digester metagenome]